MEMNETIPINTSSKFLYWLRGFFENFESVCLSEQQYILIEKRLYEVFENKRKSIHPFCFWLKECLELRNSSLISAALDECFEENGDKKIFDINVCFWMKGLFDLMPENSWISSEIVSKIVEHLQKAEKQELPEFLELQQWLASKKELSKDEVSFLKAWVDNCCLNNKTNLDIGIYFYK